MYRKALHAGKVTPPIVHRSQTSFTVASSFGQRYDSSPPPHSRLLSENIPEIISNDNFNSLSSNIKLLISLNQIIIGAFKFNGTRDKVSKISWVAKLLKRFTTWKPQHLHGDGYAIDRIHFIYQFTLTL